MVQRKLEFTLAAELEWTVVCYLDLETVCGDHLTEVHRVVDYKVKSAAIGTWQADRDPQAGLYLAARWLTDWPAQELCFAQILKPGRQRKQLGVALTSTTRGVGQMRSSLARIAQAASQITALYDRFGADRPWGFADPSAWKCNARYCDAWGDVRAEAGCRAQTPPGDRVSGINGPRTAAAVAAVRSQDAYAAIRSASSSVL